MFCTKCGHKISDEAKFCDNCGNSIESRVEKKTVYEGSLHKCVYCGEFVESFASHCGYCGREFRGKTATKAIDDFCVKINEQRKEREKIEIIKNFPVPNTIEDIIEFLTLSCSNFDANYYEEHLDTEDISDAWLAKIEQCYSKAKLTFADHPKFIIVRELYEGVADKKKEAKKKKRNTFVVATVIPFIAILLFLVLPSVFVNLGDYIKVDISHKDCVGRYVVDVAKHFEEKGFTNIEYVAVSNDEENNPGKVIRVSVAGEDDFDNKDKYHEDSVITITYIAFEVTVSVNSEELKKRNYEDVVALFKSMGFTNISVTKVDKKLFNKDGNVKSVSIGGNESFEAGNSFMSDTLIIVTYYSKN